MAHSETLRATLRAIDGRGYKAYRDLEGTWAIPGATLFVDHVQGDPFASPSRMRVRVEQSAAQWPASLLATRVRRIAFEDHLARRMNDAIDDVVSGRRGSGKSGAVLIDAGQQAIIERTAATACQAFVEVRLEVGLPAAGRRALGREAEELLCGDLAELADRALHAHPRAIEQATLAADTAENHAALQHQLDAHDLVAFVADDAILPRAGGNSQRVLERGAVPFSAPPSLRVSLEVPHAVEGAFQLSGTGIPRGITLIVGGGFHGKSTLLQALERTVHPHLPGDGRERVVMHPTAAKIRAEDGRSVTGCDIHAFIDGLPGGHSTRHFTTQDASGSTSQAAGIVEAIEAGSRVLLLDEDTSATNFLVRDARMQALVAQEHEPITPFLDRARALYDRLGVSTVLVVGGSGDGFDIADTVIEMRGFGAADVTQAAREVAAQHPTGRTRAPATPFEPPLGRVPIAASIDPRKGRREVHVEARGTDGVRFGTEDIDLRGVEPVIEASEARAIGYALVQCRDFMGQDVEVPAVLDALEAWLDEHGVGALGPRANLARPRRFEVAAALSRLRSLRVKKSTES